MVNWPGYARNLVYAQLGFYIALIICLLIAPESLSVNDGLSYFGVHRATVAWFAAGVVSSAYFSWLALRDLPDRPGLKILRYGLGIMIITMLGIVITPYSLNSWIHILHDSFGSILFITQLIIGLWIIFKVKNNYLNWLLWALQLTGGIISLIYLVPTQGYLTQGQLLFQLAFSVLLLSNLKHLETYV